MTSSHRLVVVAVAAATLGTACGATRSVDDFYGAVPADGDDLVIELRACTRDDVRATVVETATEVRVEDVTGTVLRGDDCGGVLLVRLVAPLGERDLVVAGERWVPFDGTCDRQWVLVPPDLPSRFVDCPG